MVQINFAQKTVNVKIVYYGPGMSGKTTNLEVVHQRAPEGNRGDLTSISTDGDRTLFFDYMPLDLGTVAGMRTCFQCYTVPGQVYYNSTRKLVLQGVDGVIFVADSAASMLDQNIESLRNLEENLNEYGKSLATLPHVIQWNKRDLPDAMAVEELERHMNHHGCPTFEGIANTGQGVFPTLKALAAAVLKNIMQESGGAKQLAGGGAPAPPQPQVAAPARPAAPQLDVAPPQQSAAPAGGGQFGAPSPAYGQPAPVPPSAPKPQVARSAATAATAKQRPGSAGQLMQPPRPQATSARPRGRKRPQASSGSAARRVRHQVAQAPAKPKKSFPMGIFAVFAAGAGAAIAWAVLTYLK